MFTLFTLASLLFSTTSMASIDEDIEQKARERHEQKWNEKIDYDVANTIRRCGEIYASRNREIDNYNNAVKEFRRYEHDKSEAGRAMRALARPAILRLEVEIDEMWHFSQKKNESSGFGSQLIGSTKKSLDFQWEVVVKKHSRC